jgi:hypothetical protein
MEMPSTELKALLRKVAEYTILGLIRLADRLLKKFIRRMQEFSEPRATLVNKRDWDPL